MTFSTQNNRINYSFVHKNPTWIDIPVMFKYVQSQPKGFVYSVMRDVIRCVDDDWVITYHRNTGVDYMRLFTYFKSLGIKTNMPKVDKDARNTKFRNSGCSRHARAQALDDIISFPARVSQTIDGLNEAIPVAQATMLNINTVVTRVDDMLAKVTEMVNAVQQGLQQFTTALTANMREILMYLIKLLSLGYLLQQNNNQSVPNVVALLTLIMPSSVLSCIQQFAVGLIRVIQRISGCQAQADDDMNDAGFVVSFFNLTVGIIKGMFGDVPKDVYDNLFISNKKVKLISDYIRGTTTIVECILRLWEKCVELIGDKILKYFKILPSFIREDTLCPLVDEFLAIKQERVDLTASTNQESARRVMALYEKLLKAENALVKQMTKRNSSHYRILPYLRIMIKTLDSVIARIPDHMRTGLAPRRIKPFWVYIYGDPRIGKTGVFQPYIVNELAQALKINTKYEDYTNYTYLRNCGEDYWEGYDSHPVLWYNDLFQNYAEDNAMHKAIMELTNIVDDNVYPLEMAFERKHNVYFNSQLVISNAQNEMINMPFIANKCWSGGAHLYARRNICVHFSLNPKYQGQVGIDYAAQQLEMDTNPANCVGYDFCTQHTPAEYKEKLLFPKDLYILTFTDPLTKNVIAVKNFADGIEHIKQEAISYKTKQSDFKDRLYNHFRTKWEAQAQADDDFDDAREMNEDEVAMFIRAHSEQVTRNMQAVVRELIGTEDMEMIERIRQNAQGGTDYINVVYGGNTWGDEDMFVRVTYAVETIGVQYWARQNFSCWHRFRLRFKTWVDKLRKMWSDILAAIFTTPHLVVFVQFVQWSIIGYTYYRVLRFYYGALHKVFGIPESTPKAQVEVRKEEISEDLSAQTAEGKQLPKKPQILRVKKQRDGAVAMSYDQQNSIVENIISKQMCKFSIRVLHEGEEVHSRMFGSSLCLGSDVFVMPYHFWFRFKEMQAHWESHGDEVILRLHWNDKLSVDIAWDSISVCKLDYKHCEDLVYVRINKLVQKPHIKQFFMRATDRPVLSELYMYGMRAGSFTLNIMQVQNGEFVDTVYNHESRDDPLYGGKFEKREIVIPICLKYYNCTSTVGDCGMMVMNCDSRMNNRKIMAMHTAGHVGERYGLGSLIFVEDIEEAFKQLYTDETMITAVAMSYEEPAEYAQPLRDLGLNVLGRLPRLTVPEYQVDKYPVVMLPRKTKIQPSLVHAIMNEDFGPTTMGIAKLRPFTDENGERVYPMLNAMKKIAVVSNSCTDSEMDIIQDHIANTISSWQSPYEPHILTDHEMINGCGNLNPVEMKTSAGYPYVFLDNTNGKLPFFEQISDAPVQYKMGPYLETQVRQREKDASEGKITDTLFIDTLKDETRELSKVLSGKTRLFQIAPVDFNLLIRKYFGAFLMHTQATYIRGEGAVGINANSMEWTALVKEQLSVGDDFLNGDVRNFDASAAQRIGMSNAESINKWYRNGRDWSPEHDMIRRVLFATFLNSKHIYRDVVYQAVQGNKSGTAITTWFNNLIGMFVTRLAILRAYRTLINFNKGIGPKYYGDDDSIAVNTAIYPQMTGKYYKQIMASVGLEYTSALKGEVVDGWYKLPDVSFLKRKFTFDGVKYLPQLDWQVIIEIARWSESDPTNMVDQMNRFNSSLLEASNYGRVKFNELRQRYIEYCYLLMKAGYSISSNELFIYEYCERIKWGEDYSPVQLQYDRAKVIDTDLVVRTVGCVDNVQSSNSSDTDDQHSEVLNLIAQSQTYEGKSKPSRPQVIRITRPKAQAEEEEDARDFNAYLIMIDYMKELEPCMTAFSRALTRAMRKPGVKYTFSTLYAKMQIMLRLYNECVKLLQGNEEIATAQGEEDGIVTTTAKNTVNGATAEHTTVAKSDATCTSDVQQNSKTTFVDSNAPHQPPVQSMSVPRARNCNFSHLQADYFERPMAFATFKWTSTDAIYKNVGQWILPEDYYNDYVRAKGAMIAFARPDFEFTITVNATRFHYGRLMFVVMPFALDRDAKGNVKEILPEPYMQAYSASTWPHWYQLSAGPQQSIKFVVPYRHYLAQLALDQTAAANFRFFAIRAFVMAPLSSANGTPAPVEVTLFGRIVKPEFSGSIISKGIAKPTYGEAQGEEVELSKLGITVNNPGPTMRGGPITQTFDAVSAFSRDVANFTHAAGMSVPINLASTNSMQIRQPLMNKCSDLPNSVVLGPSSDSSVAPQKECVNSETDDMSITHIVSSPCLHWTYKLKSTDAAGSTLWYTKLQPRLMTFGGEGFSNTAGTEYPLPMAYLARMFSLWRGSFKFHFSAVSSGFHSARLRIVYMPGNGGLRDTSLSTDLWAASTVRNVVWDINDSSDITVEVPFEATTNWCETDTNVTCSNAGYLYLQLINPLTSASETVNPIYIQIFVSGCDDFQFARVSSYSSAYAPDFTAPTAQGEERDPCAIPASSSMCLREQRGIFMGDVDRRTRIYRECTSNVYTSVKQLCNQLTFIDRFASAAADKYNITTRYYNPYGRGWEKRVFDDDFWLAPLHKCIAIFRFMRGSYRVHVLTNGKIQATAYAHDFLTDVYQEPESPEGDDFMNGSLALRYTKFGCAYFYDNTVFPIDITVPYNYVAPCTLTLNPFSFNPPDCAVIALSTQKAVIKMLFAVAGGDDFMLGYRMCIPRCRYEKKAFVAALPPVVEDKSYLINVDGFQYRYDQTSDTFVPIVTDPSKVKYFYKNIKDVGHVWTHADGVHPTTIPADIHAQLVKYKAEVPHRSRPRRGLFERFMEEHHTDLTDSD